MERFGEIAALKEIRKSLEKFTDVNRGAMQIEQPFRKDRDGNDAAREDGPHEETTLLDVVDHWLLS
jgi:hypothetical protein